MCLRELKVKKFVDSIVIKQFHYKHVKKSMKPNLLECEEVRSQKESLGNWVENEKRKKADEHFTAALLL